ncbi:MAG: carboxypeptidase-like regulatory domain-containing protein [Coriobacteriia bacterium]|nr:carboxypeptidase-like regulatory domain-containing protein [Coriobacteriia bacterium]
MVRIRRRSMSLLVLAFTLVVVVGMLVAPVIALAAGTIRGSVQDSSAKPIEGISVVVYSTPGPGYAGNTTTLADGKFDFPDLPNGNYWISFSDNVQNRYSYVWYNGALQSYLAPYPATIPVTDSSVFNDDITLYRGVTVKVHVDRPSGDPVENVTVQAWRSMTPEADWSPWTGTTDASGECTLTNMPRGDYYVRAQDVHPNTWFKWYTPGRTPASTYITLSEGATGEWYVKTPMLPQATVNVVGGAGWRRSLTGVVELEPNLDSDYATSVLYYWVDDLPTFPLPWDGSSHPTVTLIEGAHHVDTYGVVGDTSLLPIGEDGDGPYATYEIGIDNTPPHTTANVGTVSQSTLVLTHDDDGLSPITPWYAIDGGAPTEYVKPVPLSRGVHSVNWYSQDGAGNIETAHSGTIISGPQANVRRPVSRSSMTHGRYLSVSGTLSRARNHSRLTVLAYRWNGVTWVLSRTKPVRIHTPRRGLSRYSGSIRLSTRGSWKIVSRYEGDGSWVQSYSPPRYVKVK